MSRQWYLVLGVLGGLVIGGAALVFYGPEVNPVAVGNKAPDYRVMDLRTGDSVGVRKGYQGHVTLVNIWATWCAPCRVEMPAMQKLYDSLSRRGFRIAAVSIDQEGPKVVRDFVSELGLTFDVLHDQSGEIQQAYQTTGVPESFLLDTSGVIMKRVIGAHDWGSPIDENLIRKLMGDTISSIVGSAGDRPPAETVPVPAR
jgi:peroxiredoxin